VFQTQNVCINNEAAFADSSRAPGNTIKTWFWDFGDGTTSYVQSPTHLYANAGTYNVRLLVTNDNGCSDEMTKPITVSPLPVADFTYPALLCSAGDTVRLTGTSPTINNIAEWLVDFGDGTAPVAFTDNKLYHQYSQPGTYTASLRALSKTTGCYSDAVSHVLTVNAAPITGFDVPEVCIADIAVFKNNTVLPGGSSAGITYSWDFGDTAPGANNTSSAADGSHRYTVPGRYKVTLTAANNNGCLVTQVKEIIVSGNNFSATGIDVENQNSYLIPRQLIISFLWR
jgi:PKD repeat protein